MSLKQAPDHIKLAVDLIELLESNNIKTQTAVAALKIVLSDFKKRAELSNQTQELTNSQTKNAT